MSIQDQFCMLTSFHSDKHPGVMLFENCVLFSTVTAVYILMNSGRGSFLPPHSCQYLLLVFLISRWLKIFLFSYFRWSACSFAHILIGLVVLKVLRFGVNSECCFHQMNGCRVFFPICMLSLCSVDCSFAMQQLFNTISVICQFLGLGYWNHILEVFCCCCCLYQYLGELFAFLLVVPQF